MANAKPGLPAGTARAGFRSASRRGRSNDLSIRNPALAAAGLSLRKSPRFFFFFFFFPPPIYMLVYGAGRVTAQGRGFQRGTSPD